jgi:hypothetical protein
MMKHIEELIKESNFIGKNFISQNKTYIVQKADNYSYKDPIDGSVVSKQV